MDPRLRSPAQAPRCACTGAIAVVLAFLLASATPALATAQSDSASLHATVLGWGDRTWLYLLDRAAVEEGRFGEYAMLARFHPLMDNEYAVDVLSATPSPTDEYAWWRSAGGARFAAGSYTTRDLLLRFEAKGAVALGRGWSVAARFDRDVQPGLSRALPRLFLEKSWSSGAFVDASATLPPTKPDIDVAVGGGWRDDGGAIHASVTLLDAFNDLVYQGLGFEADTGLDYAHPPLALRAVAERRVARHARVELDVGVAPWEVLRVYRQPDRDDGVRQEERFGMAAGLAEWTTLAWLRVGVRGTWVRAETIRTPLSLGSAGDGLRQLEETSQLGVFALVQLAPRWRLESWVLREHRRQSRQLGSTASPDVDYEDRAWRGQALVRWRAPSGFTPGAAVDMDLRDVTRGDGQVPGIDPSYGAHNARLRAELGWRFGTRLWVDASLRIDLDGDPGMNHGTVEGAQARFQLLW